MPFYKRISKKTLKLAIIILLAAAVLLGAAFTWFGTFELAQFNTRSLTDWRLGGSIDYIRSADDAKQYDADGFEWFSDERGEGIHHVAFDTDNFDAFAAHLAENGAELVQTGPNSRHPALKWGFFSTNDKLGTMIEVTNFQEVANIEAAEKGE